MTWHPSGAVSLGALIVYVVKCILFSVMDTMTLVLYIISHVLWYLVYNCRAVLLIFIFFVAFVLFALISIFKRYFVSHDALMSCVGLFHCCLLFVAMTSQSHSYCVFMFCIASFIQSSTSNIDASNLIDFPHKSLILMAVVDSISFGGLGMCVPYHVDLCFRPMFRFSNEFL